MIKNILTCVSAFIFFIITSCNNNNSIKEDDASVSPGSKDALKNAIRQYPDSLLLIQNLIESYRNEGSYDSAIALTSAQIKRDTGNAFLWNMQATLYFENGDTTDAISSMEHAVNIYPLPEYLVALGTIYAEVKNDRSLKIADDLLKMNRVKSGKDAMFIKGMYYSYKDEKKKAINYFDSSLQMDYTYMFSYREKAIALYDLGKYEEAIQVLKRAVTIQNNFDEGYYWLGRCYEKTGKKDEAIQSYQTALLYDKDFTEARDALNELQIKN